MKKYEFTGETKEWLGHTLHRIRAVIDIAPLGVSAGDLGGWIAFEKNLSHDGNAWVYDSAIVSGDARVYENAKVYGDACVYDSARVYGTAKVYGNAGVCGNADVYGHAKVYGNACVYESANVYGNAKVYGEAEVYGTAEVYGDAEVYGQSKVYDDAEVCDSAKVYGGADVRGYAILRDGQNETPASYICVGPIGSHSSFTTLALTSGTVCSGCFVGTLDEFEKSVKKTHGDNKYAQAYAHLIAYFRTFEVKKEGGEK